MAPRRLQARASIAAALLVFGVAAPLIAGSVAGGPEPVSEGSTADNAQRKAAWAPDGTLYVTYVQPVDGTPQVFMKWTRDGGTTWNIMPQLSQGEAFRPCVAVDSTGRVLAAWSEYVEGVRQVFTARWDGGPAWLDREQVSFTPGYSGFPALGVDASDRVHLVWYGYDGETYRVHYRYHDRDGPWSSTTIISRPVADANSPSMGVGPDGKLHVAFFASIRSVAQVWYLHGGPDGWDAPELVSLPDEQSQRPSIAVFPSGTPAVAYAVTGNGVPQVVYSQRGADGRWTAPAQVSSTAEGGDNPTLALGDDGEGEVFFETAAGELRAARMHAGSWGVPTGVGAGTPAHWPSVTWTFFPPTTAHHALFLVWTEGPTDGPFRLAWTQLGALPAPPPSAREHPPLPAAAAVVALAITGLVVAALALSARRRPPPREPTP